ncbi:MAG TPA: hypothetical protein VIX73_31865 [Kofleriaceae bacterium]|jgi:hypothetical protein
MSRVLPPHPDLEHLRKQAKDLLRDWQRDRPDAQLADAQHAIARDHGFASWPKLRAHIESLTGDDGAPRTAAGSPFVGTWTANLAESKRHPANLFQSATLEFAVDGNAVTITHRGTGATGEAEHSTNRLEVDGEEHPSGPAHAYAVTAKWHGARVLETTARKQGRIVGRGTYEVSSNGKLLVVSTRAPGANADGWATEFEQVILFDRA